MIVYYAAWFQWLSTIRPLENPSKQHKHHQKHKFTQRKTNIFKLLTQKIRAQNWIWIDNKRNHTAAIIIYDINWNNSCKFILYIFEFLDTTNDMIRCLWVMAREWFDNKMIRISQPKNELFIKNLKYAELQTKKMKSKTFQQFSMQFSFHISIVQSKILRIFSGHFE